MIPKAKEIYHSKYIYSPDYFIGNGMMGQFFSLQKLEDYINSIRNKSQSKKKFSIELMSHAGIFLISFCE